VAVAVQAEVAATVRKTVAEAAVLHSWVEQEAEVAVVLLQPLAVLAEVAEEGQAAAEAVELPQHQVEETQAVAVAVVGEDPMPEQVQAEAQEE
jgi:hypothetical protein